MAAEALDKEPTLYGLAEAENEPGLRSVHEDRRWVIAVLLLVAGIAIFIEALTTTYSELLSIPLLALSGVFAGPA
jgi:hypothetical protein